MAVEEGSDFSAKEAIIDPLLECLLILARHYHINCSKPLLTAGLPLVNHCLTPSLFVRSAKRVGLDGRIVKRSLKKISKLVLPVVLIMKNNQVCILKRWIDKDTVDILLPESGSMEISKSVQELLPFYTGFAIYVHPIPPALKPLEDKAPKESWFWGTLWRFRRSYKDVLLAAFFINVFTLVSPLFIMNVYDRVVPNSALTTLWALAIGVFIIYAFDLLLRLLRGYLIDVAGKKADTIMASRLFQQVMGIALANKPTSVGAFSTVMREFETVRDFFTSATMTTIVDLPFVILFLFLIYYLGGVLVYVPLVMFPLVLLCALLVERPLKKVVKEALNAAAQKNSVLVESLSGLEVIKAMGAEGIMQHKWEGLVGAHALFGLRSRFLSSIVVNVTSYAQQLVSIGTIVVGVYEIMNGRVTIGALIACNILAARSLAPLGPLANLLTRYQQARAGLIDLNHLMSMPLDRPENKQFLNHPHLKGDIEFDDVSFSYPKQETYALSHVSFKIKAGEKVGIIGRIGSGKSTLHKMLLGLYHPSAGKIFIDGANLLQIDPLDLRRNIGYVAQDCMLFRGNVRENIVMTQPWADDEAVLKIAQITGADRFISQHPFGYDLHVGERGETLSGGQRQAITIARALLPNPPIILLDEPSNAMDEGSEKELLTGLMPYMQDKTLLLVTHKPSLLTLVERVIVFDKGKVMYDGPKAGLVKPS